MFHTDTTIFLLLNATAATPSWALALARFASQELPQWLVAGSIGAMLGGGPRVRQAMLRVLLAMVLAWMGARWLQHLLPMPRPFALGLGTAWLAHGNTAGFPSTHAGVAFAFALAAATQTRQAWLAGAAIGLALLIAWSRVCLGLHFPFDVAAGALLGSGCGWFAAWLPLPAASERQRNALAPRVTPRGRS